MTEPLGYASYQSLGEVGEDPELVAELLRDYVQLMLERVVEDGYNPLDGVLKIEPVLYLEQREMRLTWSPL